MKEKELTLAEKMLNQIHELAMNDSYMNVPYTKNDNLAMAHRVIKQMESVLMNIAELAQVGLGD